MSESMRRSRAPQEKGRSKDVLRKTKKPLMEKRRRARVNSHVSDIKSLLSRAFSMDTSTSSKMDMADVLEMAVKHLRSVQHAQLSAAAQTDHAATTRYRAGYRECAQETLRYVNSVHVRDSLRHRLGSHLDNCVQTISQVPTQLAPRYTQSPTYHQQNIPIPSTPRQSHCAVRYTTPSPYSSSDSGYSPQSSPRTNEVFRQNSISPHSSLSSTVTRNIGHFYENYADPDPMSSPNFGSSKVFCVERSANNCYSDISPKETIWRPW